MVSKPKTILCAVTNDLSYDQRMQRICSSLQSAGYHVTLIGIKKKDSTELLKRSYHQHRINVWYKSGIFFYAEYNARLFFYLLFKKADLFVAIDLDTILAVWMASILRGVQRAYDAHEFFPEQKNIVRRPRIYKIWKWIEKKMLPRYQHGYTVCESIATIFHEKYAVNYKVIINAPKSNSDLPPAAGGKNLLYQGAINEGRGLDTLITAMTQINSELLIYGDGPYLKNIKELTNTHNLQHKVHFKGKFLPGELQKITCAAYIGINLVEPEGLNEYYSLANKFFDYMHSEVPQVTMNFPEYAAINKKIEIAVLVNDLTVGNVADAINSLLNDNAKYDRLKQNCTKAATMYNWENEEKKLVTFYNQLFE